MFNFKSSLTLRLIKILDYVLNQKPKKKQKKNNQFKETYCLEHSKQS